MINLINKIGQRKTAKILFFASIFFAIILLLLKIGFPFVLEIKFYISVFLLSFPQFMFWRSTEKTKTYRLLSIYLSMFSITTNYVLLMFGLIDFLFPTCVLILLFSTIFYIFILQQNNKKNEEKKVKTTPKKKEE